MGRKAIAAILTNRRLKGFGIWTLLVTVERRCEFSLTVPM